MAWRLLQRSISALERAVSSSAFISVAKVDSGSGQLSTPAARHGPPGAGGWFRPSLKAAADEHHLQHERPRFKFSARLQVSRGWSIETRGSNAVINLSCCLSATNRHGYCRQVTEFGNSKLQSSRH